MDDTRALRSPARTPAAPRAVAALPLALLLGACATSPPTPTGPAVVVDREVVDPRLEPVLHAMVAEERFAGVALVLEGDVVVHAKGYGLATAAEANEVTTAFHVASVTKQFTAAAILQLVERGEVDLDRSINTYLPPAYRTPTWDGVTVHHLLTHTGGVPDYAVTRDYYDVVDGFCLGDTMHGMVAEAMAKEPDFEPGTRYEYSNIGYTLLGLAVEHVAETPYAEYLRHHVLEPMGMDASRIHVEGHVPSPGEASGHRWSEEEGRHTRDAVVTLPVTEADGGLVTTLTDFVRWSRLYLDRDPPILGQDSVALMTRPHHPTGRTGASGAPESYGYGLYVSDALVGHSGYIVGFRSHFLLDRERALLIVVFTNNTTNAPRRISGELYRRLTDE